MACGGILHKRKGSDMPSFNKLNASSKFILTVFKGDFNYPYFHEPALAENNREIFNSIIDSGSTIDGLNLFFNDFSQIDLSDSYFIEHDLAKSLRDHFDKFDNLQIRLPYDVYVYVKELEDNNERIRI